MRQGFNIENKQEYIISNGYIVQVEVDMSYWHIMRYEPSRDMLGSYQSIIRKEGRTTTLLMFGSSHVTY